MRRVVAIVVAVIVAASCIPWLRHQRLFSVVVGVTTIVLAGLLVTAGVRTLFKLREHQQSGSQPSVWLSPRLRNWLLLAVLLGLLIPLIAQFMARNSDAYKLAVATAHKAPQYTEALGAPTREAWFSEGTMGYGNPASVELTIPVTGSRHKGDLRALAVKESGSWKLKELTLELAPSGERVDLLAGPK